MTAGTVNDSGNGAPQYRCHALQYLSKAPRTVMAKNSDVSPAEKNPPFMIRSGQIKPLKNTTSSGVPVRHA
jgi:hypothetical protein